MGQEEARPVSSLLGAGAEGQMKDDTSGSLPQHGLKKFLKQFLLNLLPQTVMDF